VREYERSLRLHVLPNLGGTPIGRIQRRDLQRLVDEMLGAGADASTIRNALKPVQAIYRRLIEDGDLAINPCAELRLPAARGRRERIASPEEARALIDATHVRHRALWGSAFYAGLRQGELRALRWEAVDFANGVIRVEHSMNSYGELDDPKSRAGRRSVPIVAALGDLLADHRVLTNHVDGYVFGSTPLTPFTPSNIRRSANTAWRNAAFNRSASTNVDTPSPAS
jgi:integrase